MNKLPIAKQAAILRALTEGMSIRGTSRLVGVSTTTILKLLVEVGEMCEHYQSHKLSNLKTTRVECDEIWAFVAKKQKRAKLTGEGDCWTWTALDVDSKLIFCWLVSGRNTDACDLFMKDVASRLANRVQLTTDGLNFYLRAVEGAFGWNGCDFAQLVKKYAMDPNSPRSHRYSPPICVGTEKECIMGRPVMELVSTSYVERTNLGIRMGNRRLTRLTNAHSKKAENHAHAMALYFMVYNFVKPHGKLTKDRDGIRTTPAMAAGLTDHVWQMEEILNLMDPNRLLQ
jgi:IS1 family transposase